MKWESVDMYNSLTMLLMGALQFVGTFYFYKTVEEPAFWFFNGGITLLFLAMLNIIHLKNKNNQLIRRMCILSNSIFLVFWLAMFYFLFYKFERYPFAMFPILLLVMSSILSILGRKHAKL